ncbi:MAG TPA: NAD-dependent epimerase/dehydratase family protein [Woeseiaceae bacterium]|nr:NAD-dependent epimerase/dehydratase family protein [Woeseiaceae bacterium]
MNETRRRLMQAGVLGGALLAGGLPPAMAKQKGKGGNRKSMRILVLGGTGFIGPHMVREALRRGHEVSLFNRGRSNDELFPDLETYIGDRDNKLDALKGHKWDAVIDNSGYVPRHVADSARLLSDAANQYLFVSSISAYASFAVANDEDSPLGTMPDESVEEVTGETYGPMKALCEKRAAEEFGADRLTVLRPTYICGPGDHTDRYTYWPVRTQRGGDMLWPGSPSDPIQIVDVRDLATFTIDCLEKEITGIYNTVTPPGEFTMGDLLEDCTAVTAAEMKPVWVSDTFVTEHNLTAGRDLPIWSPPDGDSGKVALASGKRAYARGLRNRPTRETARDTLSWWKTLPAERTAALRAGLDPAREAELLGKWREQP